MTAPNIAVSTTPPAVMLSKKFWRDGDRSDPAADATSGTTMDAVNAAAVSPATAFSLSDARTSTLPDFELVTKATFDGLKGSGLRKDCGVGGCRHCSDLFPVAEVMGIDIETNAIFL